MSHPISAYRSPDDGVIGVEENILLASRCQEHLGHLMGDAVIWAPYLEVAAAGVEVWRRKSREEACFWAMIHEAIAISSEVVAIEKIGGGLSPGEERERKYAEEMGVRWSVFKWGRA